MEDNSRPVFDTKVLPEEMWEYVSKFLGHSDRLALRATDHYLKEVMSHRVCCRTMNFLLSKSRRFNVRVVESGVLEKIQIPYKSVAIFLNEEIREDDQSNDDESAAESIGTRLRSISHWNITHITVSGELNRHTVELFERNRAIMKRLRSLEVLCSNSATIASFVTEKLVLEMNNLRSFKWVWSYMEFYKQFIHVIAPRVETITIHKNFSPNYTSSIEIGSCAHVTAIDVDVSSISMRQLESHDYPKAKSLTLRQDSISDIVNFDWQRVFRNFTVLVNLTLESVSYRVLASAIDSCLTMTSLGMQGISLSHGDENFVTIPQLQRLEVIRCLVDLRYRMNLPTLVELSVDHCAQGRLTLDVPKLLKFTHCVSSNLADVNLLRATRLQNILLKYYRCNYVPSMYDSVNDSVRVLAIHIRHSSPNVLKILRSVPKLTTLYLSSFGVSSLSELVFGEIPRLCPNLETLVIKMHQQYSAPDSVIDALFRCPKLKYLMLENIGLTGIRSIPTNVLNVMLKKVTCTGDALLPQMPLAGRTITVAGDCITILTEHLPAEVDKLFKLDDWNIQRFF